MSSTKLHDRPHRVIRWRRSNSPAAYYAEIREGGLLACTLVVVKRRLPFHRRSGIVVLERWQVSILEPDGRARLDVPGGAFLSLSSAKASAVHELGRIGRDLRGRTEAQDDGRACVLCGDETSAKVPTGERGSRGAQLFRCSPACARRTTP